MFLVSCNFLILVVLVMFSSAVRAFSGVQSSVAFRRALVQPRALAMRYMSTGQEPDTTIVDTCQQKIQKALETDNVKVTGAYDDPNGSHISIQVVSPLFQGKRPVQRQQLVYKAIWEELQGPVHAVDEMICKTPEEA